MLESYYLKPVIIIAPDLQFPMLNFCKIYVLLPSTVLKQENDLK